jgi:hypothetical protein
MATIKLEVPIEALDQISSGLDQWIEKLGEKPLTTVEIAENFLDHAAPQGLGGCAEGSVAVYAAVMLATAMQRLTPIPELSTQ